MPRILILSSWVAHGHVGLCAAVPALQALGLSAMQVPMCVLSNHPGWPHVAGRPLPVDQAEAMLQALRANGWLAGCDAVLTGYMPSAEHVALAAGWAGRLGARLVVDPVLGDAPGGLYVPEAVAQAVRAQLLPLADVLTPNTFELGWMAGRPVTTRAEAAQAARALPGKPGRTVLLTSAPCTPGRTGVLQLGGDAGDGAAWSAPLRSGVPHGVGDVFSALIAAGLPAGAALGHLDALIGASLAAPHLRIAETARAWTTAAPLPPEPERSHGL